VTNQKPEAGETVKFADADGDDCEATVRTVHNDEVVDLETIRIGPWGMGHWTETHEKVHRGEGPRRWDFAKEQDDGA
jgi:hypothetical protein